MGPAETLISPKTHFASKPGWSRRRWSGDHVLASLDRDVKCQKPDRPSRHWLHSTTTGNRMRHSRSLVAIVTRRCTGQRLAEDLPHKWRCPATDRCDSACRRTGRSPAARTVEDASSKSVGSAQPPQRHGERSGRSELKSQDFRTRRLGPRPYACAGAPSMPVLARTTLLDALPRTSFAQPGQRPGGRVMCGARRGRVRRAALRDLLAITRLSTSLPHGEPPWHKTQQPGLARKR